MHSTPCRGIPDVRLAHCAPSGSRILAHLDGFGVDAEHGLQAVNGLGYPPADFFPGGSREFSAVVELPAADKVRDDIGALFLQSAEEIILTVNAEGLCHEGKGYDFQVR